ncbi:MAG TPA: metallophosphoesterase [Candidatus Limnocylindrales bacterium]|nr:metallophosphoesterase [Candidatus Limnocylindrales bacterium]
MAASDVPPIQVPDGFTVWAASDLHGQRGAVDRLLARAGLSDGAGRWVAPPGSALVVTGDVVDRGPDSVGLVRRLVSLRAQAAQAGGLVALLEGNHEMQVLGGLAGQDRLFRALLAFGGGATFLSAGMAPGEWTGLSAEAIRARLDALAPDFEPALWSFAPYARWRDVLLVHGGPVPGLSLEAFGQGAERLWIRRGFFEAAEPFPDGAGWAAYREAGIARVVYGHTPVERASAAHGGHALNVDTWRGGVVSLARIPPEGDLGAAVVLTEPAEARATEDDPAAAAEARIYDAHLPGDVDAWLASVGTDHPRP